MKIGVACGGTGGHIFPGLATANELRKRGHDVALWLAGRDLESSALKAWEGETLTVPSRGLPNGFSIRLLGPTTSLLKAARTSFLKMKENPPDVLLAMGSYASVGPICAALRLHIPVVLHEANVLPGKTISLFSRWAHNVAASFEETRFHLKRKDIVVTGMPLRPELDRSLPSKYPEPLNSNLFTVLVMGGSRGSKRVNEIASEALCKLYQQRRGVQVIHLAGVEDEGRLRKIYEEVGVPHRVHAFSQDIGACYALADLAVCRAGAATCAELSHFATPALLIPYPYASKDHQMANARAIEKIGTVDVVPEKDLGVSWLVDYILDGINSPERLTRMREACKVRQARNAAVDLATLVENASKEKALEAGVAIV